MSIKTMWVRPVEHLHIPALPVADARRLAALAASRFDDISNQPTPQPRKRSRRVAPDTARVNAVTEILLEAGVMSAQTLANTVFSFARTLAFAARRDSAVTAPDLEKAVTIALGTPADDPLWSHNDDVLAASSTGAALEDPQHSTDPAASAALADWGKQAKAARGALSDDLARLAGESA